MSFTKYYPQFPIARIRRNGTSDEILDCDNDKYRKSFGENAHKECISGLDFCNKNSDNETYEWSLNSTISYPVNRNGNSQATICGDCISTSNNPKAIRVNDDGSLSCADILNNFYVNNQNVQAECPDGSTGTTDDKRVCRGIELADAQNPPEQPDEPTEQLQRDLPDSNQDVPDENSGNEDSIQAEGNQEPEEPTGQDNDSPTEETSPQTPISQIAEPTDEPSDSGEDLPQTNDNQQPEEPTDQDGDSSTEEISDGSLGGAPDSNQDVPDENSGNEDSIQAEGNQEPEEPTGQDNDSPTEETSPQTPISQIAEPTDEPSDSGEDLPQTNDNQQPEEPTDQDGDSSTEEISDGSLGDT